MAENKIINENNLKALERLNELEATWKKLRDEWYWLLDDGTPLEETRGAFDDYIIAVNEWSDFLNKNANAIFASKS